MKAKRTRKVTVNLPADLLERAQKQTGTGITETIIAGLDALDRRTQLTALRTLKGRVAFELDLKLTRR